MEQPDGTKADVDPVRHADLEELAAHDAAPCVSLFVPTHRVSEHTRQDRLRFKNLVTEATSQLTGNGLRRPEVDQMMAPARELLDDSLFWRHQAEGLAMFLAPGIHRLYRLPMAVDEEAVVADRFQLRPLVPVVTGDERFLVLALSQRDPELHEASRFGLGTVAVPGMPAGIEEALAHEDPERQLQYRSGAGPAGGAVFHGHGAGEEVDKATVERYLQVVARAVAPVLAGRHEPLVLAGVAYYGPIMRSLLGHPHLVEGMVTGSVDRMSAAELHARAWEVVAPLFEERRATARRTYRDQLGTGLATETLEDVVTAALNGQVASLFVASGAHRWGGVDRDDGSVRINPTRQPGDSDLVDLAAVRAYLSGATVYVCSGEEMPAASPVAAVLRY